MHSPIPYLLCAAALLPCSAFAGGETFQSGPQKVHLLELYTSEGCSSCPPAEERFSTLQKNPALWRSLVPVAFHVDYWDNLGWPDRFASPAFTQRQRTYAASWGSDSVYTPEFVLDGQEFRGGDLPSASGAGGKLTVDIGSGRQVSIHYSAASPGAGPGWEAHVATLGLGLETAVRGGENGGRRLRHDFVALGLVSTPLHEGAGKVTLPAARNGEKAVAVWITQAGNATPVQAAGGLLN